MLPIALAVVIVGGSGFAGYALAGSEPQPMSVRVNGAAVRVLDTHPTIADALRAGHVAPRDGAMYAILSHRRLDAHAFPARLFVDGRPARARTRLRPGSRVEVVNGRDDLEPVEQRELRVPGPGLPDVEDHLWRPGLLGVERVDVGRVSGEITGRIPMAPGVGAEPAGGMVVALTFDDGPDPSWTPQVLQVLRDEGVRATFCVVGIMAARYPDLVKAEAAGGHALCDHTVHHVIHLEQRPHSQIVEEVEQGAAMIRAAAGDVQLSLYRPPGGTLSPEVVDVARQRGLRVLKWSVDPADYRKPPPEMIKDRVLNTVGPGGVVLMHDGGGDRSRTVAMLRSLIQELKARGYSFATPVD